MIKYLCDRCQKEGKNIIGFYTFNYSVPGEKEYKDDRKIDLCGSCYLEVISFMRKSKTRSSDERQ